MALQDILDSLSLQPAGPVSAPPGVPITIGVVPDVSQVRVTEVQMADVDLDFIGKGVIFANDDPSDPTRTGVLPIHDLTAVPPVIAPGVQGLIGTIRGQIPVAVPTDILPRLEIAWRVTDSGGNDLIASGDAVAPDGLNNLSLSVLFVPEFVELTTDLGAPGTATRRVEASVTLVAGATTVGPRTLGPVEILVPRVPLPRLIAMFQHRPYRGPTLIMVPEDSAIPDLGALTGAIGSLQSALNPVRTLARLAALVTGLDALQTVLVSEPHIKFRRRNSIRNLNSITLVQRAWYQNDTEAEDELSSLLMIGPIESAAEFFNDRSFDTGEGKFTLIIGSALVAGVRDLHAKNPASEPTGSEITVDREPPGGLFNPDHFGDALSSVRFL